MAFTVFTTKDHNSILLCPAVFSDFWVLAAVLVSTHAGSIIDGFLCPYRELYPHDALRAAYQRIVLRWLNPRNLTYIACPTSYPQKPIGFIQFHRIGDDAGTKRQIVSRQTIWLKILAWYVSAKFHIVNYIWPDRSVDHNAKKLFETSWAVDEGLHWKRFPERANRWHIQSLVVSREWQGKGIGKRLIAEVLERAEHENVVIGVEATAEGEIVYKCVGFELLGRFTGDQISGKDAGGIMMWVPDKVNLLVG
jgi:GNAT superfamily N-acetyltransferase